MKFIIFADLHVDTMHDTVPRVKKMIETAQNEKADMIISLGDILYPPNDFMSARGIELRPDKWFYCERDEEKYEVRSLLKDCGIPVYHVTGNHDTDACTKKVFVEFMEMINNYYSFDHYVKTGKDSEIDFHFVALDTSYIKVGDNYIPYEERNKDNYEDGKYPCVSEEQLDWLKRDVIAANKPTIILTHHSISRKNDVKNFDRVREAINELNADKQRVILCINGHSHLDGLEMLDGVPRLDINSCTHVWMGSSYVYRNFDDETEKKYPYLCNVAPYKEPVFACITLTKEAIEVKGYSSEFIGPTPYELGLPRDERYYEVTALTSDRIIPLNLK